jgi:structure-specific endonuclease subunit SLX1
VMVAVVFGFTSAHVALQFEYAWQHPQESRRARGLSEAARHVGRPWLLRAKLRFLYELLRCEPWCHQPLRLLFTTDQYHSLLRGCPEPPAHIGATIAPLEATFRPAPPGTPGDPLEELEDTRSEFDTCMLCDGDLQGSGSSTTVLREIVARCPRGCSLRAHLCCLAEEFLANDMHSLVPTGGQCPACGATVTWGDIVTTSSPQSRALIRPVPVATKRQRKPLQSQQPPLLPLRDVTNVRR